MDGGGRGEWEPGLHSFIAFSLRCTWMCDPRDYTMTSSSPRGCGETSLTSWSVVWCHHPASPASPSPQSSSTGGSSESINSSKCKKPGGVPSLIGMWTLARWDHNAISRHQARNNIQALIRLICQVIGFYPFYWRSNVIDLIQYALCFYTHVFISSMLTRSRHFDCGLAISLQTMPIVLR